MSFTANNNTPPVIRIASPAAGALVSGSTTITATATDDQAVSRVEFFVDGVSIGTDTSIAGGWSIVWDTSRASSGRHSLTAKATDAAAASTTSSAVSVTIDQKPTVDITRPRSLAVLEERATITALAADDIGVRQVEFFVDGTSIGTDTSIAGGWSISWNTRNVNNGRRTIRAVATDSNGQTAADSIVVTVDNDLFPSVTITSPRDGAVIFGVGIVVVSASASDDVNVEQVEFFVDGTSIGVDANGANGWSATWNPTRATIGSHTIRAVATDSIGQTTTDSNEVTVQAFTTSTTSPPTSGTVPPEVVETPAEGLSATEFSLSPPTLSAGGEIALTVALVARVPGKAAVQFLLNGEPLGDTAELSAFEASAETDSESVFTRTLPNGMQIGLHRIEVVTTDDPPRILASRTVGVVAGNSPPRAAGSPADTGTGSSLPLGIIAAAIIGGAAALAAAGFGTAGWYRRRAIGRHLTARQQ